MKQTSLSGHANLRRSLSICLVGALLLVVPACAIVPDTAAIESGMVAEADTLPSNQAGILLKSGFDVAGVTGEYVYLKKGGLLARCQFSSAETGYFCMQVR